VSACHPRWSIGQGREPRARCFFLLFFLAAMAGVVGCRKKPPLPPPSSTRPQHPACALDPGRCQRLCEGCDDRTDCFYRGGECLRRSGVVLLKKDEADEGDDVFTPGCHYECTDPGCAQNAVFLAGDACLTATQIAEWTQSRVHDSCLSVYDCQAECRRHGKAGGTCRPVPERCGAGRASAACFCS
jgi:hypothetical protein